MGVYTRPSIVTNGLVLNLDAANIKSYPGSGTTWSDLSGNNNTGTLTNSPTFSRDGGGIFTFNGTSQYMTIGDSESFSFSSNNFAIEFWINFSTTLADSRAIISQYNVSGIAPIWIGRIGSNVTVYSSSDGANWNILNNALSFSITLDTWMCVSITRIGNSWFSYRNGIQQSTAVAAGTLYNSTNNMVFAYRGVAGDGYHNCKLNNLKIYNNKGLTASEVLQNYNALKSRFNLS